MVLLIGGGVIDGSLASILGPEVLPGILCPVLCSKRMRASNHVMP